MEDNDNVIILDNKYKIIYDKFGEGGTATVEIVQEKSSENYYAAKIYDNPKAILKYIINEINILKFISKHKIPYTIKYIDDGSGPIIGREKVEIRKYLILEYASKGELLNYIYFPKEGFKEIYSKIISQKLLESLKALHNLGICHRDIKTDNIILDDNFIPKICDFGFSIQYQDKNDIKPNRQKVGDTRFIPPQMFNKQPYNTFKADIFNFGVLLFYLVTGQFGFESSSNSDENYKYIKEHKFEEYWNIFDNDEKIKNLSPEFKKLYFKIVSYNEEERPSIDQILNDDWFKEIKDIDSKQYELLEDELKKEFSKREEIYLEFCQEEVETDVEEETSSGYNNLDDECIKKEYFNSSLSPKQINSKKIKYMKNFIKIVGNLRPDIFMNLLANKIASKKIYEIKESDDSLEFDIINENENEEEGIEEEDTDNKGEEEELEYIQYKIIIQVKLFETEKKEYFLRFIKKSGKLEDYYKILKEIIKETKSLL